MRYALIALGVLLLLLVIFIYSRYIIKNKAEKALEAKNREINAKNEEIKIINEELEKRMLRAQMDPHFIFNALNSIQHFIMINDRDSALPYLSKFSKLIRQVLENSVNQQVPIADEIKLLEYYVQLESLRFQNKFDFSIEVDHSIDIYDNEIPFLLIQPYVENSILHGMRHLDSKGTLTVALNKCHEHILCTVEDNGIGRVKAKAMSNGKNNYISRGMPITSKRLELLNRSKKNKTIVSVTDLYEGDKPTGTRVEIQIPMDSD